jgi:hypothetical protein
MRESWGRMRLGLRKRVATNRLHGLEETRIAFLEALEGTTSPATAFSSSQVRRSKPCPLTTVRDPKPARLSRQVLQISFQ